MSFKIPEGCVIQDTGNGRVRISYDCLRCEQSTFILVYVGNSRTPTSFRGRMIRSAINSYSVAGALHCLDCLQMVL